MVSQVIDHQALKISGKRSWPSTARENEGNHEGSFRFRAEPLHLGPSCNYAGWLYSLHVRRVCTPLSDRVNLGQWPQFESVRSSKHLEITSATWIFGGVLSLPLLCLPPHWFTHPHHADGGSCSALLAVRHRSQDEVHYLLKMVFKKLMTSPFFSPRCVSASLSAVCGSQRAALRVLTQGGREKNNNVPAGLTRCLC